MMCSLVRKIGELKLCKQILNNTHLPGKAYILYIEFYKLHDSIGVQIIIHESHKMPLKTKSSKFCSSLCLTSDKNLQSLAHIIFKHCGKEDIGKT